MKIIGRLNSVTPVMTDETDPEAVAFAKAYLAGYRGDNRPGGSTAADDKAAEKFHGRYTSKVLRHGFAGSGLAEYTDGSGLTFRIERTPNGNTFFGTDHAITRVR